MNFWKLKERVCGPQGAEGLVPDWNMAGPCSNHDQCYGDCNIPKEVCDARFKIEMLQTCDYKYRNNPILRGICIAQAKLYHFLLANGISKGIFNKYRKDCPEQDS